MIESYVFEKDFIEYSIALPYFYNHYSAIFEFLLKKVLHFSQIRSLIYVGKILERKKVSMCKKRVKSEGYFYCSEKKRILGGEKEKIKKSKLF